MSFKKYYAEGEVTSLAKELFRYERSINKLTGWFQIREICRKYEAEYAKLPLELRTAKILAHTVEELPLSISDYNVFAGTQRDAFARSYALINPSFQVETFSGYCDPTAVFGDIDVDEEFTEERIADLREYNKGSDYVSALSATYEKAEIYTKEVAFFIEQVTGHVIPDFRKVLEIGIDSYVDYISQRIAECEDAERKCNLEAMKIGVECVTVLADRYAQIASEMSEKAATAERKQQLVYMTETLKKIAHQGADNLYEALQLFLLLWQIMCMEQAPNPFAFSVGNADRIFEPFRAKEDLSREDTAGLFKHMLVFYNVADRSWAISQNIIIGGRDADGNDLTSVSSYAMLDAYYDMNLPQPILSVKLHKNTPMEMYRELGRFFFTPGSLTPSLFNDDAVFRVLENSGIAREDLADYSIAGCQEPLIMGKDNANTTNSWLNLGKILELTLQNGVSEITGEKIATFVEPKDTTDLLENIEEYFYQNVDAFVDKMVEAGNGASRALSLLPVPFLSAFMGGTETGYDMRDPEHQGTKYNGSGCLIHGLSVIADSIMAIKKLLEERPEDKERMLEALRTNFENDPEMQEYLKSCPKFGNNEDEVDDIAVRVADKVSDIVASKKNYLGNPFRPDWSSPSTHLLYGYWVGATPDGRKAREMVNYGVDPLTGDANSGLGFRMLSNMKLPFAKMTGGYASHLGINPSYFTSETYEGKGEDFYKRVMQPLFFNDHNPEIAPFYLYVNVTTPEILRKVLAKPQKYAPSGVYIMRIHGTFVNFLDLSPAIQQDIIKRLDLQSTSIEC